MALTNEGMSPADIAAVTGGNGYNNNGWGGDGAWWIIVLILLGLNNGWGNNGFGGNNGASNPYFIGSDVQRGFDQSAVMSGINALTSNVCNGFSDVQQSLCNGFAGVNQSISSGFAQAEIADNARQIANMQQAFASQTAITQGLTGLASQFADCCCENRLGLAGLNSTIISENCADREALNNGVRDIIANQTAGIQTILDKMCQQELDAERRENQNLRTQLNMANLAQSQTAQTAQILADNARQTAILNPTPIPAYVVQNPSCCNNGYYNCGCGNNF